MNKKSVIAPISKGKGTRTKILSLLVVSLFLACSVCSIFSESGNADNTYAEEKTFTPDWSATKEFKPIDRPANAAKSADFINNPTEALKLLNDCTRGEECTWDGHTLYLGNTTFTTNCEGNELGAALILPANSEIVLRGGCLFGCILRSEFKTSYGIYCEGDLLISVSGYSLTCQSGEMLASTSYETGKFSAGIYANGTLTVEGAGYAGSLVSVGAASLNTAVYGIRANNFVLKDASLDCRALPGRYVSAGLCAENVQFDCRNEESITIHGGGGSVYIDSGMSAGIMCKELEITKGVVQTSGGNSTNISQSYGIFMADNGTITGKGILCSSGGTANFFSCGIGGETLTVSIPYLFTSVLSASSMSCIEIKNLRIDDCKVDCTVGRMTNIDMIHAFDVNQLIANRCEINCEIECGQRVNVMSIKLAEFTDCKVNIEVTKNPLINNILVYGLSTGENAWFKDSELTIKLCDAKDTSVGIQTANVTASILTFEHCKVRIETGNAMGSKESIADRIEAENLKIQRSDVFIKCGNCDFRTSAIEIGGDNSTGLIIENSKVIGIGGDIVKNNPSKVAESNGLRIDYPATITNSEVTFVGGHKTNNNDTSYGVSVSMNKKISMNISNSKFIIGGETSALKLDKDSKIDFVCSDKLYGINKETGATEEFEMKDIDKYGAIVTEQALPEEESNTPLIVGLIVVALISLFLVAIFVRK